MRSHPLDVPHCEEPLWGGPAGSQLPMARSLGPSTATGRSCMGEPVVGLTRPVQWGGGERRSGRPPKRDGGPAAHLRGGGWPP